MTQVVLPFGACRCIAIARIFPFGCFHRVCAVLACISHAVEGATASPNPCCSPIGLIRVGFTDVTRFTKYLEILGDQFQLWVSRPRLDVVYVQISVGLSAALTDLAVFQQGAISQRSPFPSLVEVSTHSWAICWRRLELRCRDLAELCCWWQFAALSSCFALFLRCLAPRKFN